MDLERAAVVRALDKYDGNVSHAARELGSSRRTLQLRMKTYGIPKGHAGRPREPLPYAQGSGGDALTLLAILGAGGLAWTWWRNRGQTVVGDEQSQCLHGLDVICRR
jgi:hypothetical protein